MMRQRIILGAQWDASLSQVMRLRRPRPILRKQAKGAGDGGSEPPDLHPFVQGLLQELLKSERRVAGNKTKVVA